MITGSDRPLVGLFAQMPGSQPGSRSAVGCQAIAAACRGQAEQARIVQSLGFQQMPKATKLTACGTPEDHQQ